MSFRNIPETVIIPGSCRQRFLAPEAPEAEPLRRRGVISGGISELVRPYCIGRRQPAFGVIIYTLAGEGRFRTPAGTGVFRPGEVWLCPPGCAHTYWTRQRWQVVWYHLRVPAGTEMGSVPCVRVSSLGARTAAAIEGYLAESMASPQVAPTTAQAYIAILAEYLDRELKAGGTGPAGRERLNALWAQVDEQLGQAWPVARLAQALHVSPSTLHRLVQAQHARSPKQMVAGLRRTRGEELLRTTGQTLEHIAAALGFATPFAFSRFFKQHNGHSPRDFRKRHRLPVYSPAK